MDLVLGIGLVILAVWFWTVGPGRGMKPGPLKKRPNPGSTFVFGRTQDEAMVPRKKKKRG